MSAINLIVDGKQIQAQEGQTLLEALLAAGFAIPNLCHNGDLEIYGGCALCVVEMKGNPKLVRSCATMPSEGMEIITDSPRIEESRRTSLGLILSDHRGDCRPPCRNACPTNQDCQGYIGLVAEGRYDEAVRLIKEDNPLPASIGRVCPHPCEDACRRGLLEGSVSIARLKQAVGDADLAGDPYLPAVAAKSGKKVAVVGAGPAGLTAAYFLARKGHAVEVFDAMPAAGGMLRYGIPQYRLPKEVLDKDVALIEKLGVKFTYNTRLGKDISIESLKAAYDAVFIGVGAWVSSPLGCENDDLPNVLGGIYFLRDVACGERPQIGNSVAVVGGGNTAIDAVRTALRLGARDVNLIYRRTRNEMPAEDFEVEEAEEEGVKFNFLVTPASVLEENGRAVGLRLQKMQLGEPDASGRRRPEAIPGATEDMRFDTIIAAIGQKVKPEGLDGLEMHKWKTIVADPATFATNIEGVFAGGDAINDGPGIAITAISHGKFAAQAIDSYLAGALKPVVKPFLVEQKNLTKEDLPKVDAVDREPITFLDPKERIADFRAISIGYSDEQARKEASRCLECGCGSLYDCKLLPYLQQYHDEDHTFSGRARKNEFDRSNPFIWRDMNKCMLCGLCVRVCRELVGATALGYEARGFEATAQPAFHLPLTESECTSCGYCAAVCPTGALQDRHPYAKTPPLPLEKKTAKCPYCDRACELELHYYGDFLLKVLPIKREDCCSIGRFGTVIANDDLTRLTEVELQAVIKAILGNLESYQGKRPKINTADELAAFLKK